MIDISTWLNSGCDIDDGLALLAKYSTNTMLVRLVRSNPKANKGRMKSELCRIAGVTDKPKREHRKPDVSFRDEFPFLSQPDCPLELKALVTDKFSSFYAYKDLHAQLFDCTNAKECADVSAKLLASYKDNKLIFAELDYYKRHKTVLGKHPVFKHLDSLKKLRKLSLRDLIYKQQKIEHNIWRINSEIEKGNKPHLTEDRQRRLREKESELSEIKRLIE